MSYAVIRKPFAVFAGPAEVGSGLGTAVVMTVMLSVITTAPASAAPLGVSPLLPGTIHLEPCSSIGGIRSAFPIAFATASDPAPAVQQDEDGDDEDEVSIECEAAVEIGASYKDGRIRVEVCSEGETGCTITKGGEEIDIELDGCVAVSYEPNKD